MLRQQRKEALIERRAAVKAAKLVADAERERRRREEQERLAAERAIFERIGNRAYGNYQHVRGHVRHLRDSAGASAALSPVEQQAVSALAHLWDADWDTIATLRRWCEPISGVRASDYDSQSSDESLRVRTAVGALRRRFGRELAVPEPSALGGFGSRVRGEQYNDDTLRFLSALVALQDGAVLPAFRNAAERRIVWEIGGGWGGFAYHFKTVCPNVTYVITGIPEFLLVSAVYLMTMCPDARSRFYDASAQEDLWRNWEEADFIFLPAGTLRSVSPPRLDLTVDIVTLHTMAPACRDAHVRCAFELGSRYLYSMLPGGGRTADGTAAWESIERFYWPNPVPPRTERDRGVPGGVVTAVPGIDYEHLVGWRRIRA